MSQSPEEYTGARIARIRKQRGLTQQGLAMRAHVSKSLLSKVECGQKPASPALVAVCARALGVSPSDRRSTPPGEFQEFRIRVKRLCRAG
ncbi:helix-turn-helix domain-containing protein [Streptomyces sp. ML-6]|nr:helix-turn-helix transcriptional regulator [Streptomyces sp. ML-6]MDK0521700.1 helix-turn-helix domain-containing protein [Streptomyces sp. ML-6]